MAATRKATGPAPSQANASAKTSEAADISGYTELHARAEILVAADTKLKQVVEKIRPHPTKLECATAFDPIRDLARDLDAQVDERIPQLALRKILHDKLATVGDSRCLEGWTWKELKERDFKRKREEVSLRELASPGTAAPAPATPKKKREAVVELESDDEESEDDDAASDDDVATAGGTPGKKKKAKRRRR